MKVISIIDLAKLLQTNAMEWDDNHLEVICGGSRLKLTFTNYGIACWHWQHAWPEMLDLNEVAMTLSALSGLRMPLEGFSVCLQLLTSGELPASWEPVLASVISARQEIGLRDYFDLVAPMQRLIQTDLAARRNFVDAGFRVDAQTDAPDYHTVDELVAMLSFCMLDPKVSKGYAEISAVYEPYGSNVNYEWIGHALPLLVSDIEHPLVYDVGCGTGAGTITMASDQPHMGFVGVERQSPTLFTDARTDPPANVKFVHADFLQLDVRPAQVCVMGAAFGHQTDDVAVRVLQRIHSTLTDGGYFICGPQEHGKYGWSDGRIAIYRKHGSGFVEEDRLI